MRHIFPNEDNISRIGGKLMEDYLTLRNIILFLNENTLPLYLRLGFNSEDHTDFVIDCILERNVYTKKRFAEYWRDRALQGLIPIDRILSAASIKRMERQTPPEEREKKLAGNLSRCLSLQFNDIYKDYYKEIRPQPWTGSNYPIVIFRKAIGLSPSGLVINANKYIEVYESYMEAFESKNHEQHQEIATAINRFFNGLEVTKQELEKYFIIEHGSIKPNPQSINKSDYMRLGYKGDVNIKDEENIT
jgi:hypothetical protein